MNNCFIKNITLDKMSSTCQDVHMSLSKTNEELGKYENKYLIITCMDFRIDTDQLANLLCQKYGDQYPKVKNGLPYIIRNGGARVTEDVIRSSVAGIRLLGVDTCFIVHHTDCGFYKNTTEGIKTGLGQNLGPCHGECQVKNTGTDQYDQADLIAWMTFNSSKEGQEKSVRDDLYTLSTHPLISRNINIIGLIYKVEDKTIENFSQVVKTKDVSFPKMTYVYS